MHKSFTEKGGNPASRKGFSLRSFPWAFWVILLYLVVYLVYVFSHGENVYMTIHDNLDSNVVWYRMLAAENAFWKFDATVPFLSGLDRNFMGSDLQVYSWLHMLLPTFYAVIAADVLRLVLSVYGFYKLGQAVLGEDWCTCKNVVLLCGLAYGILPLFPSSGLGFAFIPLFVFFVVQLYRTKRYFYLLPIASAGLFCSFTGFGFFLCAFLFLLFCIDTILHRKIGWTLFFATVVTSVSFVVAEARLFYIMFFSGIETIRTSIDSSATSLSASVSVMIDSFINGQYHSEALQKYIVLPVCGIYFIYLNLAYLFKGQFRKLFSDVFNWCFFLAILNSIVYGLDSWSVFKDLIGVIIPPLKGFSFARTLWLSPFAFYFSFCIVLCRILLCWKNSPAGRGMAYLCGFLAIAVIFTVPSTYGLVQLNLQNSLKSILLHQTAEDLTYSEFYSEELFSEIKDELNYDGEYSIAFGMHPAVLEYNGISTLDGYYSFYPQEYKEKFRSLIAPALEDDEYWRQYFDGWGGRAYVFSSTLSFDPTREPNVSSAELKIDPDVFRQMQGKYVFSRVEIINSAEIGLSLVNVYTCESSPYEIYVYSMT